MTTHIRVLVNGRLPDGGGLVVQENQPAVIRVEPADPAHLPAIRLSIGGRSQGEGAIPQSRPGGVEWRFTPWSAAGLLPVEVSGPSGVHRFYLKVEPAKLTAEAYEFLLTDLRRLAYGIIYTIYGPTHRGLRAYPPAADPVQRLLEQFAFLEEADVVNQVLRLVRLLPVQRVIIPTSALMPSERVRRVSLAGLHAVAQRPDRRRVPAVRREVSPDCYENRVVKLLLCSLRRLCQVLAGEAEGWLKAREEGAQVSAATLERMRMMREQCKEWGQMVERVLLQEPWPAVAEAVELGKPSTVFVMQPVYRELLQWYQRLQERWEATVEAPAVTLPLRSLPELYEYWCFAKVVDALQRGLGQPGYDQGLIRYRPGALNLCWKEAGEAKLASPWMERGFRSITTRSTWGLRERGTIRMSVLR